LNGGDVMKKTAIAVLIAGIMMMSGSIYAGQTDTVEFSVEGMTCGGVSRKSQRVYQ